MNININYQDRPLVDIPNLPTSETKIATIAQQTLSQNESLKGPPLKKRCFAYSQGEKDLLLKSIQDCNLALTLGGKNSKGHIDTFVAMYNKRAEEAGYRKRSPHSITSFYYTYKVKYFQSQSNIIATPNSHDRNIAKEGLHIEPQDSGSGSSTSNIESEDVISVYTPFPDEIDISLKIDNEFFDNFMADPVLNAPMPENNAHMDRLNRQ